MGEAVTAMLTRGLVVGNYCHDVLIRDGDIVSENLGGAASFISNVLDGLIVPCSYVAKVGPDFSYAVSHPPLICRLSSPTTLFHAYFSSHPLDLSIPNSHSDRLLRRIRTCEPIHPSELPTNAQFDFGLAVGVAGEITPDTLAHMLDLCFIVLVDVQAIIRTFDPTDGTAGLVSLKGSGFYHLLLRIGFLKASAEEAPFVDVEEARKHCCVIITEGKDGCRIYCKDGELQIPSFPAVQIDSTGAGDSFLGGFTAGLIWGLTVPDAALLGNFFGSLTVSQIGVPKFNPKMLKKVKDEMGKTMGCHESGQVGVDFRKSAEHEKLREFLAEAAKLHASDIDFCTQLDSQGSLQMEQIGQGDHKSRLKASLGSISYIIQPSEDLKRSSSINLTNSDE